ncbi:hypothetical protein K503DRAFT_768311 [Rhizopogon vinicolor AM-OR11-026]|uniref:Uncharacterized protein n=1 Tax=Rhizopogon vinicolor AM-OR11-026 TaxID=1314800 RepID=A0A1B7N779_9AGAM|nr:hypothetical protein K503DRAFT_768311 [Rhizopogon vinicolor AM-OR11-026]
MSSQYNTSNTSQAAYASSKSPSSNSSSQSPSSHSDSSSQPQSSQRTTIRDGASSVAPVFFA